MIITKTCFIFLSLLKSKRLLTVYTLSFIHTVSLFCLNTCFLLIHDCSIFSLYLIFHINLVPVNVLSCPYLIHGIICGLFMLAPVCFSSHDLIGEFTTNMRQFSEGKGTFEVCIKRNFFTFWCEIMMFLLRYDSFIMFLFYIMMFK